MNDRERLLPSLVQGHLATARLARRLYYYPQTDSTNDVAVELARAGEASGTTVCAEWQRKGRGRQGHVWSSPPGKDLLFSMVLRPAGDARAVLPVTLVVSLATSVALGKLVGVDVGVKWPNDVVVAGKKIAGILAQGSSKPGNSTYVVVGMGLNVNSAVSDWPADIREVATSCRTLTGNTFDRAVVLADVLSMIEVYYERFERDGFETLIPSYDDRSAVRGRRIVFTAPDGAVEADALGVGSDGALRVCRADNSQLISLYNETIRVAT